MRKHPDQTISVAGTFDGAAAWELRRQLDALPREQPVTIDFAPVRDFYDFGLAVLAHGIAQRQAGAAPVRLHGLKAHQRRMLHYFGISPADTGSEGGGR